MAEVIKNFNKFKTETQVEAELDFLAKKEFADRAFKTIVASGKNSAFPHHETKNRPLQKRLASDSFSPENRVWPVPGTSRPGLVSMLRAPLHVLHVLHGK